MEFPFALLRWSWGGVVWKAAPTFPVRGPGLFAKAAQPALLTITVWVCAAFQECLSLLSLAQNSPTRVWKVVGIASEQCRAGRVTAKEGTDHQVWGEGPERRIVVVIVLFWKPG